MAGVATPAPTLASRGGGGSGGAPPVAAGPLAGTWSGEEVWGAGAPFTAAWVVTVKQDVATPSALLGNAVAALDAPNFQMDGVVLGPTHVVMNFFSNGGKFGARTLSADLTLSSDGQTLIGPITPSPVISAPAILTLRKK